MPSYTTPDNEREIAPRPNRPLPPKPSGPLPPLSDDTRPNVPYGLKPRPEPEIAPSDGIQAPGAAQFDPPTGTPDDDTQAPPPPIAMPNWRPSYLAPPGDQAPVDQYNYTPHGDDGTYVQDDPGQQAPSDLHQISSPRALSPDELRELIENYRRGPHPLVQDEAGNAVPTPDEPGPADRQERQDAAARKNYTDKVTRGEAHPK